MHRRSPNTDARDCGSCEPERAMRLGLSSSGKVHPRERYASPSQGGRAWHAGRGCRAARGILLVRQRIQFHKSGRATAFRPPPVPPRSCGRTLRGYGVHFGSPSTVAGDGGVMPTPIAQVFDVPLCVEVATQPVPPEAVELTDTPADGTKPFSVVPVAPPTFDAAPVTYVW